MLFGFRHFLEIDMKKVLTALALLVVAGTASAQWHHHGGYYRGGYGGGWVAPLVIGGVIGYEINRANQPVIVQQPPVVMQPAPVYQYPQPVQNCTPWTEVQNPDGTITRTRTCNH
jgi:hypothetical protein